MSGLSNNAPVPTTRLKPGRTGKKNASLDEFKLPSTSSFRRDLEKRVEVYAGVSQTEKSIKVILYSPTLSWKR